MAIPGENSAATGRYLHGSKPEEQRRLSVLNDLLNQGSLRALALEGGERILDVGCGLGQLTRAMARSLGPRGRVVGVERDPDQLAEARRQAREAGEEDLVDFRRGDAVELPLEAGEPGSFDVVHTRFLLEHVPHPEAVVAAMVRAARPGGRVVLEDDDHDLLRLWPEAPEFDRLWRAYVRTYDRLGNDPYVGRRLVALLQGAGAEPARNELLFFGSCSGHPPFQAFVDNMLGLVEGAPETILANTSTTEAELTAGLAAFRAWSRRPDAALWYATCWAEARRPESAAAAVPSAREPARRPRSKVTSLGLLADSASDLSSSLHLPEVFKKIAERVQLLIDCHLVCIMLWNEGSGLLEHSYSLRYGEHVEQPGGFPLGYGLSGSAALERRAVRVPDVTKDPRYVRFRHAEVDIRSELAVPLLVKDRLVGVLDLESTEVDAFSPEHEQVMGALASQIATALENARLYEQLHAKEKRQEEDLHTAREIQKGLLPKTAPRAEGLQVGAALAPARELSGDFYDFLRTPDGKVVVVLGDVAGKSTPAALLGALAVGMVRAYALEHLAEPAELVEHVNRQLLALSIPRRFVALAAAVYDSGKRSLAVTSAGVPQPFLVRNGTVRSLDVAGVPAGGLAQARYEVSTLDLQPDDLVVFFSDGVGDAAAAGEEGETLGEKILPAFLAAWQGDSAQDLADEVLELAARHAGADAGLHDDRTVVVLRALG